MNGCKRVRSFFVICILFFPLCARAEDTMSPEKAAATAAARFRLRAMFSMHGISYPPEGIALIGLKQEKLLEVRAKTTSGWIKVKTYKVLKASGFPGPKLREGDKQVPEGIYRITTLNPESKYYLSLKLDFPNEFDLMHADKEGRKEPGSDIYIHGKDISTGCLAMGDPAMDELYTMVMDAGMTNVTVVIAPNDLRRRGPVTNMRAAPRWTQDLYKDIKTSLVKFSKTEKIR